MESLVVVSPDPRSERLLALVRGLVDQNVCPFFEHSLDETFGFAVCARPIGARSQVSDLEFAARVGPLA